MDFIPYGKQTILKDDIKEVIKTLKSPYLTTGPKIKEFEKAIGSYCSAKYCVVVSNATAALHLSSLVLLKPNDKVLTTPNSFLATSNSILYAKANPIFVDICKDGLIDLDICEQYLKKDSSIKAIYIVSFSGKALDQKKLIYLKKRYNIKILEDNAHRMGTKLKKSDISIFSFHPVKHLTTAEGGAIITNNKKLYKKLITLRNHGQDNSHNMTKLGYNYRLSDIQCALGISQLKKLNKFIQKRQKIAKRYDKLFINSIVKPLYNFTIKSYYHLYIVRIDFSKLSIKRDTLIKKLKKQNIGVQIHYKPINKQPFYKNLGYGTEQTPKMDSYYQECLSLPIYPLLSKKEQQYTVDTLLYILTYSKIN